MRGQLTEKVQAKAREVLGKDITVAELRLMPYIQYTMMNMQRIDPAHINVEDREIMSDWRKHRWIYGGASGMTITKEFWDAMNQILWLSYVNDEECES